MCKCEGKICKRFEEGRNSRCACCDHDKICHAEEKIDRAKEYIALGKIPETELLLKSAIVLLDNSR